ncbi:VOC family protein [Nocardia sp. NPDC050406]|uniref:VOC family protein n=1 Tax=Nocardia sp. NPDC050406 TaxID=3364318 RepID=UPI0037A37ED6
MNDYISPVPIPALDAVAPEVYRNYYGMPQFVTVPTADIDESRDFWMRGLGFIDIFSIPGVLVHLRRWAFQDVLLVAGEPAAEPSALRVNFSCVLSQNDEIVSRCTELVPGCVSGPEEMPWNCTEVTVVTPENTRVVMTAARPLDPNSEQADYLRAAGFPVPDPA